jgi:hypothetical protein
MNERIFINYEIRRKNKQSKQEEKENKKRKHEQ